MNNNIIRFSLLFAFFCSCLLQGDALRCYTCNSLHDIYCNDPFQKNTTKSVDYIAGSVCVKRKGDMNNNEGFVIERVGMLETAFDELVKSKPIPEGVEYLKCKTDLCNAGGVLRPSWAALTLTVTIAIAVAAAALPQLGDASLH